MGSVAFAAAVVLFTGSATMATGLDQKPDWECKVNHRPEYLVPPGERAAKAAPRVAKLYPLDQPAYCYPPKSAPERDRTGRAPRPI